VFVVGKCHRYKSVSQSSQMFVLVSRVPFSVQLCAANCSLAPTSCCGVSSDGWLRTVGRNTLPAGSENRAVFCFGSTLDNKGNAVLRNVESNSTAETSRHVTSQKLQS